MSMVRLFVIHQNVMSSINIQVANSQGKGTADGLKRALRDVKNLRRTDSDGTEYGVDIVSMSLGQHELDTELNELLKELSKTMVLIASAGTE